MFSHFWKAFQKQYPAFNFRSAGIDEDLCVKYNGNYVDATTCNWADRIICMQEQHAQFLLQNVDYSVLPKIEILGIEDTELYMSQELIMILKDKFKIQ